MKFAVEYTQYTSQFLGVNEKLLEKIDEITIEWNPKDLTLLEFLQKYQDKRINIVIFENDSFEEYKMISKMENILKDFPNLNISFAFTYNIVEKYPETFKKIKEKNLKFYYYYAVYNWEDFNFWLKAGVSDIVIGNQLCFELDKCKSLATEYNIILKTDIGIVQKHYYSIEDYQSFFIRPEDIEFYSEYIDVFNLYWSNSSEKRDLGVLYDIYAIDKYWYGNLQEIILQLQEPIDSRCLLAGFAKNRINCGRRCLSGSNCNLCKNQIDLAKTLNANDLVLENK